MIVIRPRGRLGNQMFQVMLAHELRRRTCSSMPIAGYDLPDWQLRSRMAGTVVQPAIVLKKHVFNLDRVAHLLRIGSVRTVAIEGWGMRLEYFPDLFAYRKLFRPMTVSETPVGDDQLLINVRAEDILNGWHPKYFPLPFDYYQSLIDTTGLAPVFAGQLEPCPYVEALQRRFRGATFLPVAPPMHDFQRLRSARHVVLSVSSFSWLAAFFSESAETIHLPICGLFDPANRQTMLLPVNDRRYHFHRVSFPTMKEREGIDLVEWAQRSQSPSMLARAQVRQLVLESMFPSQGPSAGAMRQGAAGGVAVAD